MASNAFAGHLLPLLEDANHLLRASRQLPVAIPRRRLHITALNRAVVLSCVSAWEAYVEELLREALLTLRPAAPPLGVWSALHASVRGQLGRFHNPNTENVRALLSDSLGLADIETFWRWQNCTSAQALQRLADAMRLRHQLAHGVNPRPAVASRDAQMLPKFFFNLGLCTDRTVRDHLVNVLGIAHPWPL